MKKIVLVISMLISFLVVPSFAKAASCEYKEQNRLNGLGANVKVDYEVKTRTEKEEVFSEIDGTFKTIDAEYYYFTVNIFNVTEELRILVTNKNTGSTATYSYADAKEGIISFDSLEFLTTAGFELKIYSSTVDDSCNDMLLSSKSITLPKYNRFAAYEICDEAEGFYLCQDFFSSDYDVSEVGFFNRINQYLKDLDDIEDDDLPDGNEGFWHRIIAFIGKYWYYLASGVIIIGLGIGIIVALRVRRRDL